jgi:hypothetical protein
MTRTPELADIIRQAIEDRLADVHTMLPGRIDSYDPATQKADVEPLIARLQKTVDGELKEDIPIIPGVPVVFPRTRAYKLTMPVQEGDRCMLVFCEASTEAYQVGQGRQGSSALIKQTDPDTFDRFNLTDAVALMGWYNDAEALSSSDQDGLQIGEDSGAIIHIGNDLVELYEKGAAEFVALAEKTNQRINDLEQAMIQFVGTDFPAHTHIVTLPLVPTGTAPSAPPIPVGTAPTPGSSVAASKVKAT